MPQKTSKNRWYDGSIRKRNDGRFEGRLTVNGITKSVYGKSEAECKRKIKALKKEFENGKINPKTDDIYNYCRKWIKTYKYMKIEPSSYDRLESVVENQIKGSDIADIQFGQVSSEKLQEFINGLVVADSKDDISTTEIKRIYAYSTMKKVYELLSMVYRDAYIRKELVYNPMQPVYLPKQNACTIKKKELFSLTPQQISELKEVCLTKNLDGTYKYRYGLIILLLLNTGMRIGEMLALTFDKINFDDRYIRIDSSMQSNTKNRDEKSDKKRVSQIKEPKTRNSIRLLPINDEIQFLLDEIIEDNKKREITTNYVCSSSTGTNASLRNVQRTLNTVVEKTNLPHIWLHILRHTFGSELIRKGVDVSVVSKLMGHSDIQITYQHYVHVIEEEKVKAMQLISIS